MRPNVVSTVAAFAIMVGLISPVTAADCDAPVVHKNLSTAPTDEQIATVRDAAARIPADLRKQFEYRFAAWKKTWSELPLAVSSNPHDSTHSEEFRNLVALGRDIIPAVVEKLIYPENFFALQLYDTVQEERRLVLSCGEDRFEGEQARARKTIRLYVGSL